MRLLLFVLLLSLSGPVASAGATGATAFIQEATQEASPESPTPLVTRLLGIDPENPPDLIVFLGRFHPLVVHFPIGLLLVAFLMEFLSRGKRFSELRPAVSFVLFLGALSAVFAVAAGLLLAASGDYGGDDLWWHKWLGIGVAVLSMIAYIYKRKVVAQPAVPRSRTLYAGSLFASVIALTAASHFGGTLTHGAGYLTSYMPEPLRSLAGIPPRDEPDAEIVLTNIEEAVVYPDIIHPILNARCASCHGPRKVEGDLRLTTPEEIRQGGENGAILTAGDASASDLYRRLTLEPNHDDHMPPSGRRPLTDDQIQLIGWWIDSGASFDQPIAQLEVPADIQGILERMTDQGDPALAIQVPPADPQALQALADAGILAMPLSVETNLIQIQTVNVRDRFGDDQMALLEPVAEQIAWLNLGNTAVTDAGLAAVANFPNVSRLHLEKTAVTDAGLTHLANLKYLGYLNLYGTKVTDAGLDHLEKLPALEALYLWQSGVSQEGAARLRTARPGMEVNMGWEQPAAVAPDSSAPPSASAE